MALPLMPTSLVGSYAQPDWLIDKARLGQRLPPRVILHELWRVPEAHLLEAQNDATIIALDDQHRAGVDIVTDGEMRRESYSNRFANALDGVDLNSPGESLDRTGKMVPVPRVVSEIRRREPVEAPFIEFLKAHTYRPIKITLPGPFTMTQQAQNDYYDTDEDAAMAYAAAVNEEIRDLFAAGADVVQLDEPYMQARPDSAKQYAVKSINRALDGIEGETAVHICFGYAHVVHERPEGYSFLPELEDCAADEISIETAQSGLDLRALDDLPSKKIILGVIDLSTDEIETPETVAARIRPAVDRIGAERIIVAPDCGMKYMRREVAFGKLKAMCDGAAIVRGEL